MLTGQWKMIACEGDELGPGESILMTLGDDGTCSIDKGPDRPKNVGTYSYDEAAKTLEFREDGEVVATVAIRELTADRLVGKFGPDVLVYEKV